MGNWVTALWALYTSDAEADRYAIFQDDCVAVRNLRQYLEACEYPETGYWNLYTFPENERNKRGWYLSNQCGKGAVGLVFSSLAVRTLLASQHMVAVLRRPHIMVLDVIDRMRTFSIFGHITYSLSSRLSVIYPTLLKLFA